MSGIRAPDLGGRDEPVVGVPGRHPHVHDGHVRLVRAHLQPQVVGVGRAADDLVARVLQQRRDPLAQQGVVVGDHDAQARCVGRRLCSVARSWRNRSPAGRRPPGATWNGRSTRWPASSRKPSGLSRSTRRSWRRSARSLGWELGAVWEVDPATAACAASSTWHDGPRGLREFEELSAHLVLEPGVGLPGRVAAAGRADVGHRHAGRHELPARAGGARAPGLHAAFGFPLRSAAGTVGVMEFFSRELREPDERLLETMRVLGSQVGQFVARRQAEEDVRAGRVAAARDARGGDRRRRHDGPPRAA